MKRNVLIIMLLLITGGFSLQLAAQKNLEALVKKCETMTSVDMNVARQRNTRTKVEQKTITVTFSDNTALMNEFLDAFRKDEATALQTTEDKKGGRIQRLVHIYKDAAYVFSYNESNKQVRITVREGENINSTHLVLAEEAFLIAKRTEELREEIENSLLKTRDSAVKLLSDAQRLKIDSAVQRSRLYLDSVRYIYLPQAIDSTRRRFTLNIDSIRSNIPYATRER